MIISHDMSYISDESRTMMDKGYACEDIHSLRLEFRYTDVEQEENRNYTASHKAEELDAHRIQAALARSEKMASVMEQIAAKFPCYQYQRENPTLQYDSDQWDLFFWCNGFHLTLPGITIPDRDYSYFTLSFNERHTISKRAEVCQLILDFLQERYADNPNLNVAVQYSAFFDEGKIKADAEKVLGRLVNQRCHYCGKVGKVLILGDRPFFRPLRAKKSIYRLTPTEILKIGFLLDDACEEKAVQARAENSMEGQNKC